MAFARLHAYGRVQEEGEMCAAGVAGHVRVGHTVGGWPAPAEPVAS